MESRDLDDIAVELKGIAATLCVYSEAFADGGFSDDVVGKALNGMARQIDRLGDEIENHVLKPHKNRLKELRTARGIDLEELEELSGISQEILECIEHEEELMLNTREIATLAEALEVKPSEIFTW